MALIETQNLGVMGGVVGIALSFVVGQIINAGAIGFSILVSLAAGSYPASRATKLDPIRALRHD